MAKLPELTDKDITFIKDPRYWTNENVKVTAQTKITGYTIQTSQDNVTWENNACQEVTKNGKVYARLSNGYNSGKVYDTEITKIDKLPPNEFTPEATSTTKSITVKASTTDAAATSEYGSSGIAGYRFSKDNGSTWTDYQISGEYTWDKLQQTTNYTIKVEAKDKAGNVRQESVSKETGTVTALVKDTNIKFTPNTTQWVNTSDGVKITVSTTVTDFILQTSIDGINWNNSTSKQINKRGETIYARLWDGYNAGISASYTPTNIDDSPPTCQISITTENICKGESVGAKLDLSDQYSGISTIKYVLSTSSSKIGTTESLYKNQEEMPPSTDPINLYTAGIHVKQSDVSHVGNEYIHVLVIDNVGNKTEIISSPIYFGNTYLLANKVSVGDYVSYDATNAYSYTSPEGTGTSHGNGDSSQNFKSSSDMKWRVLRVDNGEVVLISETPTKENLKFKGAIFYLYAEQEINSICALYGHGIGANKNKNFSYRIGNESYDTNTNNHKDLVIEDSGARSLSYNDVEIAYGSEYVYKAISDGDNNSGTTGEYFPSKYYYPSFSTSYGVKRLSASTYVQTTKKNFNLYDAYRYGSFKKEIENELIGSTKKDGRVYLLSTRCTSIPDTKDFARYYINKIIPSDNYNSSSSTAKMEGHWLLDCYSDKCVSHDHENINDSQGLPLRPIVYLKSTVETAASTTNGSWKILDR